MSKIDFEECVKICLKNKELVSHFDRLNGSNLSLIGSPIEIQVDISTGRIKSEVRQFTEFVYECIWSKLPERCFEKKA